jgi:hypothetical protein
MNDDSEKFSVGVVDERRVNKETSGKKLTGTLDWV